MIDDSKTFDQAYYGPGWPIKEDHGTAHISVVAQNGDAVSLTSTVNTL
jgi:gamma-glutamyltranspeptidase/glutathione hydrolase/leukotriene-C4 hydrolase